MSEPCRSGHRACTISRGIVYKDHFPWQVLWNPLKGYMRQDGGQPARTIVGTNDKADAAHGAIPIGSQGCLGRILTDVWAVFECQEFTICNSELLERCGM